METIKEQNKYCEYSNYCKDNNKNIYFICDYCGKEMDMNEVRECSFFNISSNNDIELREEWYEYLRNIIKNRDYIPEDAIDGAGDWWLSKIPISLIADEVLKVVVEKIKEEKTRLKNVEWNPQWNLEIEDKIEEVNKILQLLSNLSTNKENEK